MHTSISNLKLKQVTPYLILSPLCEEFARGVHSQSCDTLLGLIYFPVSLMPIKGLKEYK